MKSTASKLLVGVSFLLGMAGSQAQTPQAYQWYDNGKPRQLELDDTLVVEFGDRQESSGLPRLQQNGVRMWDKSDPAAARAKAAGAWSPLLRDATTGNERALPGNVIVRLNPNWSNAQVQSWLAEQGVKEVGRLPIGNNVLIVLSPPGLAALALANKLQESGTVIASQPNWWQKASPR